MSRSEIGNVSPTTQNIAAHRRLNMAFDDLVQGLSQWRVWWILAFSDVRQRYRRSALGQFWLTISMAVTIAGIGLVFGLIFNQPLAEYLPYLGVGLIAWGLLSNLINELATCFIGAGVHLTSYPGPRSIVIFTTITRNLIAAAHNFLIIPLLFILFAVPLSTASLLMIPAIVLIAVNAVWFGLIIGPLCARFRDLPPVIASATQLIFFVTPILYRPDQLRGRLSAFVDLNPFASFIEIVRAPALGMVPALSHYLMVAACTIVGFAIAIPFYARYRGRIVYWL